MDTRSGCVTWSGVASCGVSVVLFMLSRHEAGRLQQLQSATSLPTLGGVEEFAPEELPMIVAVRGRTGAQEPIISDMTGTASVIAEVMEELSSKTQNERGEWTSESQVVTQQRWEAAWYLTDDSAVRVDVAGSIHAELIKETYEIAKEFRAGQRSVCTRIIDRLTGYQPLGVRKTERCLPVNTPLTVVGEIDRTFTEKGEAKYVIGRPNAGKPFYITSKSVEELRSSIKRVAKSHTWLAIGFGAVGIALLGHRTWKQVKSAMRYRQIRKQLEAEVRSRRETSLPSSIASSSPRTDDGLQPTCIVCWDRPANAAFIPCGHNCVCRRCGYELTRCPICRRQCVVYRIYPL